MKAAFPHHHPDFIDIASSHDDYNDHDDDDDDDYDDHDDDEDHRPQHLVHGVIEQSSWWRFSFHVWCIRSLSNWVKLLMVMTLL